MNEDRVWSFVQGGATVEPHTEAELRAMIQEGRIGPHDFVHRAGGSDWRAAIELLPDAFGGALPMPALPSALPPIPPPALGPEPGAQYFSQNPGGGRIGPAAVEQIKAWAVRGQVSRNGWLIDAASAQVRPVTDFPEIIAAIPKTFSDYILPKNSRALASYYIGVFGILGLCVLVLPGVIMGAIAIWLGIGGLKFARENPSIGGRGHAITGIVLGSLWTLVGVVIGVAALIAALK